MGDFAQMRCGALSTGQKQRVNIARTQQLLDTDPDALGSACPFCMRMLTDGLAEKDKEDIPSLDIAEILRESVE